MQNKSQNAQNTPYMCIKSYTKHTTNVQSERKERKKDALKDTLRFRSC